MTPTAKSNFARLVIRWEESAWPVEVVFSRAPVIRDLTRCEGIRRPTRKKINKRFGP